MNACRRFCEKNYFKIVIGGDGGTGKTTFSKRLTGKLQADEILEMTPGVDFHSLKIKKNIISLQLWDCGGQDQFRYFISDFFGGASVTILIYAVDSYKAFKGIEKWLNIMPKEAHKNVFLIGNKIDILNRSVKIEEAMKYSENHNFRGYYEISALNNVGIEEFELDLVKTIEEMFIERKKKD